MPEVDRRLGQIMVVPGFLSPEECERYIELFSKQRQRDMPMMLGVSADLEPVVYLADFSNPEGLVARLKQSQAAAAVFLKYLDQETIQKAFSVSSMSDINEGLGRKVHQALTRAINDPRMFVDMAMMHPLVEGNEKLAAERDALLADDVLGRDGEGFTLGGRAEEGKLALAWFHISLLETEVLGEGFRKMNRATTWELAKDALADGPVSKELAALFADLFGAPASDTSYASLLGRLHELLGSAEARLTYLERYLEEVLAEVEDAPGQVVEAREALKKGERLEDKVEATVVRYLLSKRHPSVFVEPGGPDVAYGVRNTQTLDMDEETTKRYSEQVDRLRREFCEPFFGIPINEPKEFGVLKYNVGGYIRPHVDACRLREVDGEDQWVKVMDRDVSVLIYLSKAEDFDGGDIVFTDLHLSLSPQQGMAVAFPSDHRFEHYADRVTRGVRYVMLAWMGSPKGSPVGEPWKKNW